MADVNLGIKFTLDTQDALSKLKSLGEKIKEVKKDIQDTQKLSGESLKSVTKVLSEQRQEQIKAQIDSIKSNYGPAQRVSEDDQKTIVALEQQLKEYVKAYAAAEQQIRAEDKATNTQILKGKQELSTATLALKKEEVKGILDQEKKRREAEREGLTGEDLASKAKEQADQATAAYEQINTAYKTQVEQRQTLAQQLISTQEAQKTLA